MDVLSRLIIVIKQIEVMKKDSTQQAANVAKVGLVILWGLFMFALIKSHL